MLNKNKINIVMADHAGFCFGVKRAVDAICEALKNNQENKEVWTIGLPIHNPQEVKRLEELGLKVANSINDIPDKNAKVLIRAHGEPLSVLNELKLKNAEVIDTTCPFVSRAQKYAADLSKQGYYIILLGDKNHPEIQGIMGHVDKNSKLEVIKDEDEAKNLKVFNSKAALISQTTQQEERLAKVAGVLVSKFRELYICNTICKATAERQEAVRALAEDSLNKLDGMVLIGGRASANTGKLRDIAAKGGLQVLWIEDAAELEANAGWFKDKVNIGIAAGASTPEWLIKEICSKIVLI
ncbi:MAG: 4-hydroxy-3-methylbut-2-enyl diphosphate reductase [Synergistaceae bacterium]|nr:4-hydroxy-3-methylbut-2-enyl diphosphate reductase [Synergistaceae bacterium]